MIVIPEGTLDKPLDRSFLGLAADRRVSRGGFCAFFFLVVLGFLARVGGPVVHAGALFLLADAGNPVRPRRDELVRLLILGIVVRFAAMGSR